ncbi:MAG: hypothetical protein FWF28_09150 [Micrococcales bacterium]|nr:hypothetical protein [Micrococcales bacterium]
MTLMFYIGWAGGVTSTVMLLPQAIALLRTGDTKGMAWPLWVVFIGTSLGWWMHGLKLGQAFMMVSNTVSFITVMISLWYLRRDRKLPSWWLVIPGFAFAAFLAALDRMVGSAAYGATVVTPIAIAKIYQAVKILRDAKVTGVSLTSWLVQLANELIWLTWGLMAGDPGTIISAVVTATCNAFVLVALLLRRAGAGPFFYRQDSLRI